MTNPLLAPSTLPYQLPDFAQLRFEHYREAFDQGLAEHDDEIRAIVENPDEPTFENTIVALERSGKTLQRAATVFFNNVSSDSTPEMRDLEGEYAPKLAAHEDAIMLNSQLYARVAAVAAADNSSLDPESRYLVERTAKRFELAGAALGEEDKRRLAEYNQRLATLTSEFGTKLLEDTNDAAVVFDSADELDGLSEAELSACRAAAEARGLEGKYLVTLILPTQQPALASLTNRESRRRVLEAAESRGNRGNAFDTNATILELVKLRAQRAELLGYPNHAAVAVADQTAATPEAIEQRIYPLAEPAVRNARAEAEVLQAAADADADARGVDRFALQPWDWDYYTEKVRTERYAIDTAALKPYFEYDRVLRDGVFWAAGQLYGLRFEERDDLVAYHPDARVFEVFDEAGEGVGLFIHDVYTRDSKRGGAWMNNLVEQSRLEGTKPVIVNNLNVPKPADGQPTLLTLDEASTLFHEFGHALHGLLADGEYESLSGTNVPRDFVEFPSQVNEMWQLWPEVLAHYARHVDTGEPLDPAVCRSLEESGQFNQGFETSAYLGAALLDQEWHKLSAAQAEQVTSVADFEAEALRKVGLDLPLVPPRYRSTYFNHTFGGGYDAGYYGYIWSEVLDADTVEWFKEHGGLKRENGEQFRRELLSRGRSRDLMESYRAFRGRDAEISPLLTRRGLDA